MKYLTFFILFVVINAIAFAQDSSINLKKFKEFKLPDIEIRKLPFKYSDELVSNNVTLGKAFLKPGIYILPLDNMPCFVPDVSSVSKIPNQQFTGSAVKIPNKIIVEVK